MNWSGDTDLAGRALHAKQHFVVLARVAGRLIIGWKLSTNWSSRSASRMRCTQAWIRSSSARSRAAGSKISMRLPPTPSADCRHWLALAMICGTLAIFSPICTPPMLTVSDRDCCLQLQYLAVECLADALGQFQGLLVVVVEGEHGEGMVAEAGHGHVVRIDRCQAGGDRS